MIVACVVHLTDLRNLCATGKVMLILIKSKIIVYPLLHSLRHLENWVKNIDALYFLGRSCLILATGKLLMSTGRL